MEIADLVLQYVEVLLSWPVITLVLGLLALIWLRKPIGNFLNRVRSAEGYGVRLDAVDPAQQLRKSQDVDEPKSENELAVWIRDDTEVAATEFLRLFNGYWWERAFNIIYGSQIEILEHLEAKGDSGEKYVNLVPYFEEFLRRGGPANTQMPDYLAFLQSMNFIGYQTKNGEQLVKITPFGVNFLSYLRAQYPAGYKLKPW